VSIRLNKLLAQRGIGARRKCDTLIESGVVKVNGVVVREPGSQVNPDIDRIDVAGRRLPPQPLLRYYALNKPVGVITTLDDPEGRRTLREFLPPGSRVYPVGRLDADTSGLLVLTNDGELAHRLMHPRYGVEKHYRVRVDREPRPAELGKLAHGVEFEPGVVSAPAQVRILETTDRGTMLSLTIHEGRYRQVRRMCEAVGLTVLTLHRAGYGPVRLGPLPRGVWRELSDDEVASLRSASARPRARSGGPRLTQFDRIQRRATADRSSERRSARARVDEIREEHRARGGRPLRRTIAPSAPGPSVPRTEQPSRPATRTPGFDAPRGGARKRPASRGPRPDASRGAGFERPRPASRGAGFGAPRGEGRPRPASRGAGFGAPRGEGRPRPASRGAGFGAPRGEGRPRPASRTPRPNASRGPGSRPQPRGSGFTPGQPGARRGSGRTTSPPRDFGPRGPRSSQPRPASGGTRPRPAGPRTGFAGPRPSSARPRPRPAGPRTGSAGPRPGSGGPRSRPAGPRTGFAGPRPGSSGSRPGPSGPRRSGGPRPGSPSSKPGGAAPRGKSPRDRSGPGRSGPPQGPRGRSRG